MKTPLARACNSCPSIKINHCFLQFYPNKGHLEYEENVGPGASHWSFKKGGFLDDLNVDVKTRASNKKSCSTCLDLGIAGKVLLGIDIKWQIGLIGQND